MNKLAELRKRGEVPAEEAPTPDIELLTEIRDLLRRQQGLPKVTGLATDEDQATAKVEAKVDATTDGHGKN